MTRSPARPRVVVIGRTGQLGADLVARFRRRPRQFELIAPGRDEFDLERLAAAEAWIGRHEPAIFINTAAFHNLVECEAHPDRAFHVNATAVHFLAAACRRVNALFVTISTDYVFDGSKGSPYLEDDRPRPLQVYGMSKLAGEHGALTAHPEGTVVVRTCGLYGLRGAGSKGGNFVDKRVSDARHADAIEIACEQTVSPTYTADLARALVTVLRSGRMSPGLYHMANRGACGWHEFTRRIYHYMRLRVRVIPVDRGGFSGSVRRPLFSALASARGRKLRLSLPPWSDALRRYLTAKHGTARVRPARS